MRNADYQQALWRRAEAVSGQFETLTVRSLHQFPWKGSSQTRVAKAVACAFAAQTAREPALATVQTFRRYTGLRSYAEFVDWKKPSVLLSSPFDFPYDSWSADLRRAQGKMLALRYPELSPIALAQSLRDESTPDVAQVYAKSRRSGLSSFARGCPHHFAVMDDFAYFTDSPSVPQKTHLPLALNQATSKDFAAYCLNDITLHLTPTLAQDKPAAKKILRPVKRKDWM